jgi:hypothetical protein
MGGFDFFRRLSGLLCAGACVAVSAVAVSVGLGSAPSGAGVEKREADRMFDGPLSADFDGVGVGGAVS